MLTGLGITPRGKYAGTPSRTGHGRLECDDSEANDDAMLRTGRIRERPQLEPCGWLVSRHTDRHRTLTTPCTR